VAGFVLYAGLFYFVMKVPLRYVVLFIVIGISGASLGAVAGYRRWATVHYPESLKDGRNPPSHAQVVKASVYLCLVLIPTLLLAAAVQAATFEVVGIALLVVVAVVPWAAVHLWKELRAGWR
jgi:hypothetical protein